MELGAGDTQRRSPHLREASLVGCPSLSRFGSARRSGRSWFVCELDADLPNADFLSAILCLQP
jgi:hypothetical protein